MKKVSIFVLIFLLPVLLINTQASEWNTVKGNLVQLKDISTKDNFHVKYGGIDTGFLYSDHKFVVIGPELSLNFSCLFTDDKIFSYHRSYIYLKKDTKILYTMEFSLAATCPSKDELNVTLMTKKSLRSRIRKR